MLKKTPFLRIMNPFLFLITGIILLIYAVPVLATCDCYKKDGHGGWIFQDTYSNYFVCNSYVGADACCCYSANAKDCVDVLDRSCTVWLGKTPKRKTQQHDDKKQNHPNQMP
jgi:hypothetical protein